MLCVLFGNQLETLGLVLDALVEMMSTVFLPGEGWSGQHEEKSLHFVLKNAQVALISANKNMNSYCMIMVF